MREKVQEKYKTYQFTHLCEIKNIDFALLYTLHNHEVLRESSETIKARFLLGRYFDFHCRWPVKNSNKTLKQNSWKIRR